MARARLLIAGKACACKYRSMASDFHRPTILMVSLSILAQRSAVAPPGRKDLAVTFSGSIPVVAWAVLAACCRAAVIWRAWTDEQMIQLPVVLRFGFLADWILGRLDSWQIQLLGRFGFLADSASIWLLGISRHSLRCDINLQSRGRFAQSLLQTCIRRLQRASGNFQWDHLQVLIGCLASWVMIVYW
jgi:hypothetical protein